MKKIAITPPDFFRDEPEAIMKLLRHNDYWRVHIRKPSASAAEIEALIRNIDTECYPRLSLHDHFEIAAGYSLGGIHINRRNSRAPSGWKGLVSRSLHSVEEIPAYDYDYAFLSPIYPSISKPGYCGNFDFAQLKSVVNSKIFALGGVTPEKFGEIQSLGFGGAAMLGAAWRTAVDCDAFRLQFITHPLASRTLADETLMALRGGCRWIQLRHKDADTGTIMREAAEIRSLCDQFDATFIIDDHVELVHSTGADGVHLGKNDMPVAEARKQLGYGKIIGATANTFADIEDACHSGADYIGLGPFRFTTTKQKLSPTLGIDGYTDIFRRCADAGISLPIVAIGGITQEDIPDIMDAGAGGVAISGAIVNSSDPILTTKNIINILCQNL